MKKSSKRRLTAPFFVSLLIPLINLTIMNKSTTYVGQRILSQILSLCPKNELAHIFIKSKSDYKAKRLKSWEHFVTMMFSVLAGCTSLRETCMGREAYEGKLNHINIKKVLPRSTLSDANKRHASTVFQEIFNYFNSKYKGAISYSTLPNEVLSKLFLVDSTYFLCSRQYLKHQAGIQLMARRTFNFDLSRTIVV